MDRGQVEKTGNDTNFLHSTAIACQLPLKIHDSEVRDHKNTWESCSCSSKFPPLVLPLTAVVWRTPSPPTSCPHVLSVARSWAGDEDEDEEGHGKGPAAAGRNRWPQPSHGSCSCVCLEITAKCQFSLHEALNTCLMVTTFRHKLDKLDLEWQPGD